VLSQAYVVTVRLAFESVADRDEVLKHFADAAETVTSDEPGVTSYRASIDITDPTKMIFIERCINWLRAPQCSTDTHTPLSWVSDSKARRSPAHRVPG